MSADGGSGGWEEVRHHREVDRRRRGEREQEYRRAVLVGLGVSLAVHLVLIFWISAGLYIPPFEYRPRARPAPLPPEGLEVVITEPPPTQAPAPEATRPLPEEPPPEEEPSEEETEEEAGTPVPAEAGDEEERMTNAERLQPREGEADARLWRRFWDEDVRGRYLGGSARADSAIRAILGKYLDSLQLTEEEYRKARDWTFGDGDERWGISPEGIHLGNITIPIPVGEFLSPTGPKRRELERELRELREIQRQEALGDAEKVREERIEEMRRRAREEREEAEADSTGGGGG